MMKKVLYGVALTLFAGVSVGSLQSCKDDLNDIATQTSYDLTKLRSQLDTEAANLNGRIDALAIRHQADIDHINTLIGGLQQADIDLANRIDGAASRLDGKIDQLAGNVYDKGYIDEKLSTMNDELDALKQNVQDGDEALYDLIQTTQETLTQMLNLHQADIDNLQAQVDQLVDAIDAITNRMNKQVTGILIQGVNSPVFGDFRTPLGVKSNILFNWYGYNTLNNAIVFPSNLKDISATGEPGLPAGLTPNSTWTANPGYYGDQINDVTLGKVYVTLNPVGAQFDNIELSIENSAGAVLPYKVTLTPSDYVLKHGYSRAEANDVNGFYEGEVKMTLNDDNVKQIEVAIEENLKVAMKDALKDPSKTTAKALVKAVLEQLDGKIPAYGLRYSWTNAFEDENDPGFGVGSYAAVLSQYDLAVATALPLSYHFLADYTGSGKIPTFGHIDNLILKLKEDGDLHFNFKEISFDDITISLPEIKITTKDVTPTQTEVVAEINPIDVYQTVNGKREKVGTTEKSEVKVNVNSVVEDLSKQINESIKKITEDVAGWSAEADASISNQLQTELGKVAAQINDMMDSINGQIDQMITNLGNKFDPYFNKVNKAIDLYNKVANKINNFLKDPNAYLQVAAFYSMGGTNYGIVSGKASDPTPFVGNGEAFKLYLSSYTGELIVPACKKYVAVTAVNGNDSRALADINSAIGEDFNAVLEGNQIEVTVPAAALKNGNVYEFTYQALDYRGYTSTKKFYIEVK